MCKVELCDDIEPPIYNSHNLAVKKGVIHKRGDAIMQKTRLTVTITDGDVCSSIQSNSAVMRSYDVISVIPTSDKTFQAACTSLDVDIISIPVSSVKLPFHLNKQYIAAAISRGVMFEIIYTHALQNKSSRKNLFTNAAALIRICRGENIILSSASKELLDLRGPHDIVNLAVLFGLKKHQGLRALSDNCHKAILHGESRRVFKCAIDIRDGPSMDIEGGGEVEDDEEMIRL